MGAIRFVLVEPSHPGNIGATARAMKTMGFQSLVLVKPKLFPHATATAMAAGADELLTNCVVVDSLNAAIKDCHFVVGTSARPRGLSAPALPAREAGPLIAKKSETEAVAVVFGRERTGLTNEELAYCHQHLFIPTNPDYRALNLAQAVQLVCYEIAMGGQVNGGLLDYGARDIPATVDDIQRFFEHLTKVLVQIKFLNPKAPKKIMVRLKRLFNRIALERFEVRLLRGILTAIEKQALPAQRQANAQIHHDSHT